MSVYVDASAVLKLHVKEADTPRARVLLASRTWATGRHTFVDVRRNLARLLGGRELDDARAAFGQAWAYVEVIELTQRVCERAAELAEETGARALDALHLGAAAAAGAGEGLPVITFDRRLADAARSLGWHVLGA